MTDKKSIGISSLIALGLILSSIVVPTFFDKPKYYCESRDIGIFECDGFSKYVSDVGKCLNATQEGINYGNKICRTGWIEIVDDRIEIIDEPKNVIETEGSGIGIKTEICNNKECVEV